LDYSTRIEHGVLIFLQGALMIAKDLRMNDLCILYGFTGHAFIASKDSHVKIKPWQLGLGHGSERSLVVLAKKGLLRKDKLEKLKFCDNYTLGKQHTVKFGSGVNPSSWPFEYVYSDLWGSTIMTIHMGGSYFLTMIDDYPSSMSSYFET